MVRFYTRELIFGVCHWGLYSEVYGYCLIAVGTESFEWFELDIFGLAKQFNFHLHVVEVTFNITTQ